MTGIVDRLSSAISDRYTVLKEVGQGGMATVYLAEDVRHHRKVAIKVLHPELSAVLGGDRFLKEIELTANLQHPHILPLFDSGSADGLLYYVMPFIDGETLRDRLTRERQLPIPDAVRIAADVSDALDYAHKRGVVHRDIKPENILLHGGRPLIADFGIALAVQQAGGERMTQTGLSLGTPQYMSPEQATGERDIDARSDIYSLGAVTYEMLTGEAPFTGPTSQAIVAKVITTDPGSLAARRKSIPTHVEDAVLTALEKVPADRFASAGAFGAALNDPSASTRTGVRGRASQAVASRLDRRILAGTAVTALAIGSLATWLVTRSSPGTLPRVAFVHQGDTTHRLATSCCASAVAISPDGRRIAYGAIAGMTRVVMVRNIDDNASHIVPGTESGRNPSFSPDGQWILFEHALEATGSQGTLKKVPVGGGSAITVTRLAAPLTGTAWLDDGTVIYTMSAPAPRGLHRISVDGGTPEILTTLDTAAGETTHRLPSRIPGSNLVLFNIGLRRDGVLRSDIATFSPKSRKIVRLGQGFAPKWARGFLIYGTRDGVTAQRYAIGSEKPTGDVIPLIAGLPMRGGILDFGVGHQGEIVALTGEFEAALHITRRDGLSRTLKVQIPGMAHFDGPRFSPDGERVATAVSARGGHEIYVLDPAAGTSERLTFGAGTEHFTWTADGRGIVYVKDESAIAVQSRDRSGGERVLWKGDSRPLTAIAVSPRWIAVVASTAGPGAVATSDILIINPDSGVARSYLETTFNETAPAISPDGRWLAYVSDETGREEVYVASFPDASRGRQIISTAGAAEPVWGRSGSLYYRGADGRVVEASYTSGVTFSVTSRTGIGLEDGGVSVDGADFDVSPSGDEFVTAHIGTVKARLSVLLGGLPAR